MALLNKLKSNNKKDEKTLEDSLSLLLSTSNSYINIKINNYEDLINQTINEIGKAQNELIRV